jgi:hypothetical protein
MGLAVGADTPPGWDLAAGADTPAEWDLAASEDTPAEWDLVIDPTPCRTALVVERGIMHLHGMAGPASTATAVGTTVNMASDITAGTTMTTGSLPNSDWVLQA